jgi:arylsulfatase A-like enzyme
MPTLKQTLQQRLAITKAKIRARVAVRALPRRHAAAQRTESVPPLAAGVAPNHKPLNVLMIVTDQQRHWLDLPQDLPLPAHDWLRTRGVALTNYHVNTTPCSPSRSNIYFGQHTQHTKMVSNYGAPPFPEVPKDMPSLGDYLRANGYYTAYKGKWHISEMDARYDLTYGPYPNSVDALEYFGFSDYNFDGDPHGSTWTGYKFDRQIASESATWLHTQGKSQQTAGKPWVLAVNFVNPHDIMYFAASESQVTTKRHRDFLAPSAPAPVDAMYAAQWNMPLPASFKTEDLSTKPWAHKAYGDFCTMAFGALPHTDEAAWLRYVNYYLNCIRDVDAQIMTVLQALQDSGQLDNTIIVFTADHGEMAGAHGLRQKGPFIYRENTRVPFLIAHPDLKSHAGKEYAALGSAVDIVPTILSMAGVSQDKTRELYPALKGVDLSAALQGNTTERDLRGVLFNYNVRHYTDPSYTQALVDSGATAGPRMLLEIGQRTGRWLPDMRKPGFFNGIHQGRYKFARYFSPLVTERPDTWEALNSKRYELELYDLHNDPDELKNLAWTAADKAANEQLIMTLNAQVNGVMRTEIG